MHIRTLIRKRYAAGEAWFNVQPTKKRLMMTVGGACVAAVFGFSIYVAPAVERHSAAIESYASLNIKQKEQQNKTSNLSHLLSQDVNLALKKQKETYQVAIERIQSKTQTEIQEFVAPAVMVQALEQLFHSEHLSLEDMMLVGFRNLPATPVVTQDITAANDSAEVNPQKYQSLSAINLYQKGIEIRLKGSFDSLYRYIKAVESMPWRFKQGGLTYHVDEYPLANITLVLETFNDTPTWIHMAQAQSVANNSNTPSGDLL